MQLQRNKMKTEAQCNLTSSVRTNVNVGRGTKTNWILGNKGNDEGKMSQGSFPRTFSAATVCGDAKWQMPGAVDAVRRRSCYARRQPLTFYRSYPDPPTRVHVQAKWARGKVRWAAILRCTDVIRLPPFSPTTRCHLLTRLPPSP